MKRETLSGPEVMKLLQKPHNKHHVTTKEDRTWEGITYASKLEMELGQKNAMLVKVGKIRSHQRQFPIKMVVNGILVSTHYVDYRVEGLDGSIWYEEAKGRETEVYRLKMRLLFALDPGLKQIYKVFRKA